MKKFAMIANAVALALFCWLTPPGAFADENDPPSRVARLAYFEGSVSVRPAGTEDWVQAQVNRPLTTGDVVWSDQGSRTELQLDGSVARLADSTELTVLNLGDEITQLQLSSGTLVLRVRRLDDRETYEVDTPNLAFSVLRPGVYRISVDNDGNTSVTVRSGQGEVSGGGSAYSVYAGDADVFSGTDQLAAEALPGGAAPDAFGAWCNERDARWEHSVSARYVSPDIIGYEDLDDQGSWRSSPEYGYVWYPAHVDSGWAPYHDGHWSYIAPWGYTWVDDQPWGFAPFHYGRWMRTDGGWGWIPAPPRPESGPYIRPVYAPALVAWVGAGIGVGVAWFALGPREVYVPSYPVSANYVRNINVSNTTVTNTVVNNIYNTTIINNKTVNVTYVNRGVPGAVAATSVQAFSSAQPVARNRVAIDTHAFANAPIRSTAPAVVPTKQAVLGSGRAAAAKPAAAIEARPAVVRTPPPAAPPSIDRRLEAIKNNGGKPLSVAQARAIPPAPAAGRTATVRVAPPAAPVSVSRAPSKASAPTHAPTHAATPVEMPMSRPAPSAVHARELPVPAKPSSPSVAASALEREHLQQQQQLAAQQAQERQRLQQQQEREHQQAAKQQADQAKQQADKAELEKQHQQQTQQLQQKHIEEQQELQAKQREQQQKSQEAKRPANPAPPSKPPQRPVS
jgi:hypothetical protein